MPTRDNTSDQKVVMVLNEKVTSNGSASSAIIDVADYDMGVMFASALQAFTDGVHVLTISEDDSLNMSNPNVVVAEKIIGSLPTLDMAITAEGAQWKVFGVHSTKRYLRLSLSSTGVSSGAQVVVIAIMKGETGPQSRV